MNDPLGRTKVVMRHLPPVIAEPALMDQIDGRFFDRYNWHRFCPGKNSQKDQRFSRLYIDFKRPEDVLEFAEVFDGHIFVNEKGVQFKAVVEYAPSQCVPKARSKKDGREGSILEDPEYLKFLEFLAKPVENLPSAEIQIERREAERAATTKDAFVVTPLMDFIRQKRAARRGSQRVNGKGKLSRRAGVSVNGSNPCAKQGSEKRRGTTLMYVTRNCTKVGSTKDDSTYVSVSRKEEKLLPDKPVLEVTGTNQIIHGVTGTVEQGKKVVILKGKERGSFHEKSALTSSMRNSAVSSALKQNHQQEASGIIIRSILSHKEGGQNAFQSGQEMLTANAEKGKRPPRPPIACPVTKDYASIGSFSSFSDNNSERHINDKVPLNGKVSVTNRRKHDKRTRNKGRPDMTVWAPSSCSEGYHSSKEILTSSSLQAKISIDSLESTQATEANPGTENMASPNSCLGHRCNAMTFNDMQLCHREVKHDTPTFGRNAEIRNLGGRRVHLPPVENDTVTHVGHRGPAPNFKELDSPFNLGEGKFSRRGPTANGSQERQVWVKKSGSAS